MSRAQVFIPILSKYGDVDVLISSKDHDIKINHPIKYHINGLGFTFGKNGGIDYWQSFFKFKIIRLLTTLIFAATRSSAVIISRVLSVAPVEEDFADNLANVVSPNKLVAVLKSSSKTNFLPVD